VVKFIQSGGAKTEAARRFALGRSSVYRYLDADKKGALAPKKSWGKWRKLDPAQLSAHVKKHPDATLKELQKVFGVSSSRRLGAAEGAGLHAKKLIKYRQRNEVQRWLFRREREKFNASPSFTWTSAAGITACSVNTHAHPGASGYIRPWRANDGNAPESLRPPATTSWWLRWCFKVVATRRWWTFTLKSCCCPCCRRAA
jgi:hypothetical protein